MEWSDRWKVTFEPTKSHTVILSNLKDVKDEGGGEDRDNNVITFGGTELEAEPSFELLGVVIDRTLSFAEQVKNTCRHGGAKLSMLRRMTRILDKKQCMIVYKAFIRSGLEYATESWMGADASHLARIDKLQERAFRIIGVTAQDRATFNLQSLGLRRRVKALETLYRLHLSSCPPLLQSLLPSPKIPPTRLTRYKKTFQPHALDINSVSNPTVVQRSNGNKLYDLVRFERSFLATAVEDWNNLPAYVVQPINRNNTPRRDKSAMKSFKKRAMKFLTQ